MTSPSTPTQLAAAFAWRRLFPDVDQFPAERLRRRLVDILPDARLDEFLDTASREIEPPSDVQPSQVVRAIGEESRQSHGIYMTPPAVADGLAAGLVDGPQGDWPPFVVDPAAGTGQLLAAAARRVPDARLVGIERQWALAVVAAVRLVDQRSQRGAGTEIRIHVGDGLAADENGARWQGRADLVLLNPPYVGEKGNRALFDGIRRRHADLQEFVGPRCDLAYLFVHRGLSFLRKGGRLALLTPAYWLSATGARRLRADLAERAAPELFVRIPSVRLFDEAPGHHSLVSLFRRTAPSKASEGDQLEMLGGEETAGPEREIVIGCTLDRKPDDWSRLVEQLANTDSLPDGTQGEVVQRPRKDFGEEPWSPFAGAETAAWGRRLREKGTPLGELLEDRQGFVSGADRVSTRRLNQLDEVPDEVEQGDPLFVWKRRELTERMQALEGLVVRPLLRGSDLEAGELRVEPPETHVALYIDGELADGQDGVVDHLKPLKPALEDRREVRRGRMPWYRLHWPRSRREQTQPKLVVPRRARKPCFALDLSASVVSSDCTYLLAPDSVNEPVAYLETMMDLLNRPFVERYLRNFGKRKGELLEFYAEPLRSLPMPVELKWGELKTVQMSEIRI